MINEFRLPSGPDWSRLRVNRRTAISTGVWRDVEMRWRLAGRLTTVRQHARALRRFEEFCAAGGVSAQPAAPETVAAFLARRREIDRVARSSLRADALAIRTGHLSCGLPDPTTAPEIRAALSAPADAAIQDRAAPTASHDVPGTAGILAPGPRRSLGRPKTSGLPLAELEEISERFKLQSLAKSTREAYGYALRAFDAFCTAHALQLLPAMPDTVALFLTDYGLSRKPPSLMTARAAIRWIHVHANFIPAPTEHPEIENLIKGHARLMGTKPNQKHALTTEEIIGICRELDAEGGLVALRDKALFLLGFAGAFRRSEITWRDRHEDAGAEPIRLDIQDLEFTRKGLCVTLRKSKTDQARHGREVFINYGVNPEVCPVLALENWVTVLKERRITAGPVFRAVHPRGDRLLGNATIREKALNPNTMVRRLKLWAERIGIDPSTIGGHSLRAGHVTAAAEGKASFFAIMKQGGWRSADTVQRYYRRVDGHKDNSSGSLGL